MMPVWFDVFQTRVTLVHWLLVAHHRLHVCPKHWSGWSRIIVPCLGLTVWKIHLGSIPPWWLGTGCFGHVSRGIIHIRKYHLWRVLDFEALVRDVRVPGVPVSEWTSKARFNQIQGHPPVVLPGVTRNPHQDFDSNTEISCARKESTIRWRPGTTKIWFPPAKNQNPGFTWGHFKDNA